MTVKTWTEIKRKKFMIQNKSLCIISETKIMKYFVKYLVFSTVYYILC